MSGSAGRQLRGRTLFEHQKEQRPSGFCGPRLYAQGIHTPENAGALFRLADSIGARELTFVTDDQAPWQSDRVLHKVARSTEKHVAWTIVSTPSLLAALDQGLKLLAVEITARSTDIFQTDIASYDNLICGSERYGIPEDILEKCTAAVHIPMFGVNGSMNVAQAMTVASFEWCRQKQLTGETPSHRDG